jgi:hypothetical protein
MADELVELAGSRRPPHADARRVGDVSEGETLAVTAYVRRGNNGGYQAEPGWDACTGWGSPGAGSLLQALGASK